MAVKKSNQSTDPLVEQELETVKRESETVEQDEEDSLFDPLGTDPIEDDFFNQLAATNVTADAPQQDKIELPVNLEPLEQLKVYQTQFGIAKSIFIDLVESFSDLATEKEFYEYVKKLIKDCFFVFPDVFIHFSKHIEYNYFYYSRVNNRKGFITDFLILLENQCAKAVDSLNNELAQDLNTAAYFELSEKQENIQNALEELKN